MNYLSQIQSQLSQSISAAQNQYKVLTSRISDSRKQSLEYLNQFLRSHIQQIIIILLPIAAVAFLVVSTMHHPQAEAGLAVTSAPVQASASAKPTQVADSSIKVDVSGAVSHPGVVALATGSRVDDALKAVGGYSDQADINFLAQGLNLAQKLNDGDKIFIPNKNQSVAYVQTASQPLVIPSSSASVKGIVSSQTPTATSSPAKPAPTETKAATTVSTPAGPVNINTATATELDALPGIGAVYAQDIINGRPYTSTEELCSRKVIKNSTTCQKIQSLITI